MEKFKKGLRDFVSEENRKFKFKIGKILASSLSGFIAGAVFATIFWVAIIWFMKFFMTINRL